MSSTSEPAPNRAAVEKLKAGVARRAAPKKPNSCALPVLKAVGTCALAGGTAVVGTATGPGDMVIVGAGGAMCGLGVVEAYDCVTK